MKFTKLFLCIVILAFSISTNAQTKNQVRAIVKDYDLKKINTFTKKMTLEFIKDKAFAVKMAKNKGWPIIIEKNNNYSELMKVINGYPIYYTTYNINAAKSTRANTLFNGGSLSLNIEGQNMIARVWDGGVARSSHQEYDGIGGDNRYSIGDGSNTLHFHAAHVTGTIMASGVQSQAKGMAPQCSVVGFDWNNDYAEMSLQTSNGMLISNHSYGDLTSISDQWFGAYNSKSRTCDIIMNNAPYYLMVSAAGNIGEGIDEDGNIVNLQPLEGNSLYDKLSSNECSKNSLVVANAEDANIDTNDNLVSVDINPSSSQGPTDDYRIKPDITGNGTQLFSTFDAADDSYGTITGTSMASPNVAGTLLLLQQYYNEMNGNFMKAATLKGLALHTADDAGINGPDAIFGWGLLNAKKAAETIYNSGETAIIEEITLSAGETYSTSVSSDDVNKLIASISWTDPAGNVNENVNDNTPVLVNDLDIRIQKDGITYYPYKLTSVTTNAQGDNLVDPFERIDINNASGVYTITVTHKGTLTNSSQNFSLIITGLAYNGDCNAIEPTNTNATLLFGEANFSWDNVIGATYELRYKASSTSTWTTVSIENENYIVTGLSGTYNAQVRSICSDNTFSNWVNFDNPPNFVLKNDNYIFNNDIIIFQDNFYLNINIVDNYTISSIKIFNLLGQRIFTNTYNNNNVKINKIKIKEKGIIILKIKLTNDRIGYKKIYLN